jgi:hypothetical protein
MGIVEEEADEVIYWLELLVEAGLIRIPQSEIRNSMRRTYGS